MATDYDWHPVNKGQSVFKVKTRNLGWWILLAILISVIVHILLYLILSGIRRSSDSPLAGEVVWRNQKEQLTIDQDKLNELLSEPFIPEDKPIEPEKLSNLDMVDESLDEFDLMEQMKVETIRMSPVDTPQIFSPEAPQAPAQALDMAANEMEIPAAEMLSRDLAEMRNNLIDSSALVSEAQPVMELKNDDLDSGVDTDEFFRDAAAKAFGNDADEFVKGYATLDGLIGRTGGLPSGEEKIALPTDILFGFNEFELKEEARLSMMKLAYIVQTNPDAQFIIEGHTDSIGGDEFNRELSLKRAKAVRSWLTEKLRIDDSNIQVMGLGKSRPIVSTTGSQEEQALNRRVEIVVKKP